MLTKETMIKVIKQIQLQDEFEEKVSKAFELINDSYNIISLSHNIREGLYLLLGSYFNEFANDWINWWLYEDTDKDIIINNDVKKDLTKIEDFVDFLFEDCKK